MGVSVERRTSGWHIECSEMSKKYLGDRSTFMPAEKILYSHIMKMRSHRAKLPMAKNLQNTGCTMHSLILTTGR